jgi:maltose/moltooligosaccharide transporter
LSGSARVTPATMIILGAGWFGFQVFWGFHGGPMPLYLRTFTDSKFEISLVLSLAGVTGCVVPSVVGYLSDRSATRFGRRRPYILLGFLGVFLCLLGLPHVPALGSAALVSGLMYFALRFAETPFLSLLPDLTPPQQRSTASGVMNLLGSVGLIACFAMSFAIWDDHPIAVFRLAAAISFGAVLLSIALIREPEAAREPSPKTANLLGYLRSVAVESDALRFFAAQFFWWLGFWMISTFATLFAVEELKVAEGSSFLVLLPFTVVSTLFVLPLGMLGDRYGRKGILSCAVALWAATAISIGLSQTLTQAIITVAISAIPFACVMGVGYAYMLDLVPQERTAEFVGLSVISIAVAQILGPAAGGALIDQFGYRSMFPVAAVLMLAGLAILQLVSPRPRES